MANNTMNTINYNFINILSTNIECLNYVKLGEITNVVVRTRPHLICLQETWLKPDTHSDLDVNIDGYSIFRKDRSNGARGGGLLTYVRNDLSASLVTDCCASEKFEVSWIRISLKNNSLYVANVYRPPSSDSSIFNALSSDVEILQSRRDKPIVLLTGDFNCHHSTWLASKDCHGNPKNNDAGSACFEFCQILGLKNMVKGNTFLRNSGFAMSVLDLVLTDNPNLINDVQINDNIASSSHACIAFKLRVQPKLQKYYSKISWKYHLTNWPSLCADLDKADWSIDENVDDTWSKFKANIKRAMDYHIPKIQIKRSFHDQPWFTDKCAISCQRKQQLWKKWKISGDPKDKLLYDQQQETCARDYKEAQSSYNKSIKEKLSDNSSNPKAWWHIVKGVIGQGGNTDIPTLIDNNVYYENPKDKAELLKNVFATKANINDDGKTVPMLPSKSAKSLNCIKIRSKYVYRKLSKLKTTKATGPDGIPARVLKECAFVLCRPLSSLFSLSLDIGVVPSEWKCANVVAIHKCGSKSDPNNYRPISLLSIVSKIMESLVNDYLQKHLFGLRLITNHQYGFRPKHSSLDLLTRVTQSWSNAIDKGQEVSTIALDISRAFDRVWHKGLLSKLMSYGIGGQLYRWIKNFLSDRSFRVVHNGQESNVARSNAGVPQGSILGPTLFLVFINDISEIVTNQIDLFADDTTLSAVVPNVQSRITVSKSLQADLDSIADWADDWLVIFNIKKTQKMNVSRKSDSENFPPLFFQGDALEDVKSIKLLGVTITCKLDWNNHIDRITKRAGQCLGVLRKAKHTLPVSALATLYKTHVRSLMEYCSPVWQGASSTVLRKLDSVQHKAIKILGGNGDEIPSLNIYSLGERRAVAGECQLYRMIHHIAPDPVSELLPSFSNPIRLSRKVSSSHHLQLKISKSRTDHHYASFLPTYARMWNSLPNNVIYEDNGALRSLQSFKVATNKFLLASR